MSLSKEPAFSILKNRFVCGYRNIAKEPYAGNSGIHPINGAAVATTNGAGPHNLQLFVLDSDGTVLHCLPGFWDATDLVKELELAEKLKSVWEDRSITPEQKIALYKKMQTDHVATHPKEMVDRSHLQHFDAIHIFKHLPQSSDAVADSKALQGADVHALPYDAFKTTDRLMHERLADRPFRQYREFDIVGFTNYGAHTYDKMEHEIEGSPKLMVKGNSLREVIKETDTFANAPKRKQRSPAEGRYFKFAKLQNWLMAYNAAAEVVKAEPNKATGYELRSIAAFKLGYYQHAESDSARAQWLGSRHPAMAQVRTMSQRMLKQTNTTAVTPRS